MPRERRRARTTGPPTAAESVGTTAAAEPMEPAEPVDVGAHLRSRMPDFESAEEAATRILRQAILEGLLPPGRRLRQDELAGQIGTSRIPLRDALRHLQAEGLVEIDGRRGARVVALDADDVREIYEMRIMLEAHLTRLAIGALDDRAASQLVEMSLRMDADADDLHEARLNRRSFYAELYRHSGRERMRDLVLRLRDDVHRYHVLKNVEASRQSHAQLRGLIARRDAEGAAAEIQRHLVMARDDLVRALSIRR